MECGDDVLSGQDLLTKVCEFIDFVEEDRSVIPTDFRLCRFLGVSLAQLEELEGFDEAQALLDAFREDYFMRRIEDNPKLASLYLSRLKSASADKGGLVVTLNGATQPFD